MMPTFAFPCDVSRLSTPRLCTIYWRATAELEHIFGECEICFCGDLVAWNRIRLQLEFEAKAARDELKTRGVRDADLDEMDRLACLTAQANPNQHDFTRPVTKERKCNEISRTQKSRRLSAR